MIKRKGLKWLGMMCVCSAVFFMNPSTVKADEAQRGAQSGPSGESTDEGQAVDADKSVRQDVVDYALTFLGNPYVYGGSDPNTGTDCSGFTSYVLEHAGGVDMSRSSRSQAVQGTQVSAEQMQPGDLVFYANGSRINHVGLYIGDGQIVHASTERTGIKISPWTYRNPVKIVSVLG